MSTAAAQPKAPPSIEQTLKGEAARFLAEEAQRASKEPQPAAEAAQGEPPNAAQVDAAATAALLVLLWDFALANLVSKKLKLTEVEQALVTAKAEPVVRQYLPPELFLGPLGALAATMGGIYAVKLMAPDEVPAPASQTVDGSATPTPAGAPGVPA